MSSESTPVDPQATRVPYGWTENEGYLLKKYYWADKNSIKTMLQDDYKIPNVKPLITRLRDYGDVIFLFESTDSKGVKTYYVWNGIANIVCRIDGQKDLTSIYKVMDGNSGYLGKLALTEVSPAGSE